LPPRRPIVLRAQPPKGEWRRRPVHRARAVKSDIRHGQPTIGLPEAFGSFLWLAFRRKEGDVAAPGIAGGILSAHGAAKAVSRPSRFSKGTFHGQQLLHRLRVGATTTGY